jgi:dienelactone hydrolase
MPGPVGGRWPGRGPGLENQCWKDSWDSISYRDSRLPGFPRATCELQGYAYDAKLRGARLARLVWRDPAFAEVLERQAADLKRRFNRDFWVEDGEYFAIALDADGRQVDSLTSNNGHLLWSGIVDKAADLASVADQLEQLPADAAGLLAGRLDLDRLGGLGHSFGGNAALQWCRNDRRCRAAANLDGALWTEVGRVGLDRPVLQVLAEHPQLAPSGAEAVAAGMASDAEAYEAEKAITFGGWRAADTASAWEGEAGSPVTVESLPARGRPPEAAARRAGLEGVEKSLPAPATARPRRSGTPCMLLLLHPPGRRTSEGLTLP